MIYKWEELVILYTKFLLFLNLQSAIPALGWWSKGDWRGHVGPWIPKKLSIISVVVLLLLFIFASKNESNQ